LGLRFTFIGESHIPRKGHAILAINHVGYLDFAIAGTAVLPAGRYVRFMAKKQVFDHPIAGPLMKGMHHISVDRNNGSPSFIAALKVLRDGEIVGVFPEATISRTFELKEMKSGVVRLAMESGAPIIPTIVWGSQRLWTKKIKRDFGRNNVPIIVAMAAPYFIDKNSDIEAEMGKLRSKMEALLKTAQSRYPDSGDGQFWQPASLGGSAPTAEALVEIIAKEKREREIN
jgi:1-acyl-sn-glycerol-3-phosphate acyltransferase